MLSHGLGCLNRVVMRQPPSAVRPPSPFVRFHTARRRGEETALGAWRGSSSSRKGGRSGRTLRFGLTLSLAQLSPEAGPRLRPAAVLRIRVSLRGPSAFSSPPPSRAACQCLTQTFPHPSSPVRTREAAIRYRDRRRTLGTPSSA